MKRVIVASVLAILLMVTFVVPVSADVHHSGQVDVNGDGIMDYYYTIIYDSTFVYKDYLGNPIPKTSMLIQNVIYLKSPSDVVVSGSESWLQPNLYWPNGSLSDNFHPVENPDYTWDFIPFGKGRK